MKRGGLCECGCGQPTNIATRNVAEDGIVKGQPMRFISGHHWRRRPMRENGYKMSRTDGVNKSLHRQRAEKALGKSLPKGAIVQHFAPPIGNGRGCRWCAQGWKPAQIALPLESA